jgi:cytochrome c oxidase subunit 2
LSELQGADQVNHFRRVALLWLLATVILTPIVVFVLAPGMPPGNGTVQSAGQVADNTVLLGMSTPVALAVLVYLAYAFWAFRERQPDGPVLDGPPITGNSSVQMWWLIVTTTLVLFLAGFGSVRLLEDGSGGGQGPNPLVVPAGKPLQVQVIAQQWQFTYRYPSYGGIETPDLVLPANTLVEFHVTSLDVIHSFWAYQLGVKVDANPGEDNVAYVTTKGPMSFQVHCAELCGVWHGYMYGSGTVRSKADFASWISGAQKAYAPAAKTLPPYSLTYFPSPLGRGG